MPPTAPVTTLAADPSRASEERLGVAAAAGAAILYGAAYPATAVALRSFSPLAVAGLSCTLALVTVIGLALAGVLPRPAVDGLTGPRLVRLLILALLGGVLFIVGVNIAVAISGPTITGFVAPLYAVFGTLFAIPLLGERVRASTFVAFGLAFAGTALLAGTVPTGTSPLGVLLAFVAAAMFGLYVVLARRWSVPYRLDGTLVTIANLIGRGPLLLAAAVVLDPARVDPGGPGSGRDRGPADDRLRVEHRREPPAHGVGPARPRGTDVGRAPAHPGRLRGHRGGRAGRPAVAGRPPRSRPDPGCDGRRQRHPRPPGPDVRRPSTRLSVPR